MVFCWLKNPRNTEQIDQVINSSKELAAIPGVIDIVAGKSVPNDRPIVDDSFDVGLVMTFKNNEDLSNYIIHGEHVKRVVEVFQPLCQRIVVYDVAY